MARALSLSETQGTCLETRWAFLRETTQRESCTTAAVSHAVKEGLWKIFLCEFLDVSLRVHSSIVDTSLSVQYILGDRDCFLLLREATGRSGRAWSLNVYRASEATQNREDPRRKMGHSCKEREREREAFGVFVQSRRPSIKSCAIITTRYEACLSRGTHVAVQQYAQP